MPLIYSFVARGTTVLVEAVQPIYEGNFQSVALQFLERCPADTNKFVYPVDGHTFNFLVEDSFTFLCVADAESGRELPYAFLDSIKGEFKANHAQRGYSAQSMGLQKAFGPIMLSKMDYLMEHPEEASKVRGLQRQVREVQEVMESNIQQVLQRGERMEDLVVKTERLRDNAGEFQRKGVQLRKKMYWQNKKWWCIIIIVILIVLVIIFLSICFGGGNCFKN